MIIIVEKFGTNNVVVVEEILGQEIGANDRLTELGTRDGNDVGI